jgi:hypothetical protein
MGKTQQPLAIESAERGSGKFHNKLETETVAVPKL